MRPLQPCATRGSTSSRTTETRSSRPRESTRTSTSAPGEDELLDGVGLVVKSPGIPGPGATGARARERAIPVVSEIELGARLLPNRIVGITGTNGKTTTTALMGAMFEAAGIPVEVAGNIGSPLTSIVVTRRPRRVGRCASSPPSSSRTSRRFGPRWRCSSTSSPTTSTATAASTPTGTPSSASSRTRGRTTSPSSRAGSADAGAARRVEFAGADPLPAEPRIPGAHNRENAAAATAAARAAGIGDDAIAEALRTLPGVEHRIEDVGTVAGVRYVNDSKATNVAAALRALRRFRARGSRHPRRSRQGGAYGPLADAFGRDDRAYLIGEAAEEIAAALEERGVPFERSGDLATAVAAATRDASEGDVVLLSPACASFDQFLNFEQRGEEFGKLVQKLTG